LGTAIPIEFPETDPVADAPGSVLNIYISIAAMLAPSFHTVSAVAGLLTPNAGL